MFWPGMGDPAKRKKTLRFLAISLAVGIAVVLASTTVISQIKDKDPLYHKCLNGLDVQYHVSATLEVRVDGKKWVKPDIADTQKDCERSLIFSGDGTIRGAWTKKYPFEIGQFLWMANFPLRDMDETKSRIYVNGVESPDFIHTIIEDDTHYRAEFVSKNEGAPTFTPPQN